MLILIVDIIPFSLTGLNWPGCYKLDLKGVCKLYLGEVKRDFIHDDSITRGNVLYPNLLFWKWVHIFYKQFQFLEEALVLVALEESCFTG